MKKIFIIALASFVSACACFECDDEVNVAYQSHNEAKLDCDYFDGRTCYRYVYKKAERHVAKPAPVRYRPCNAPKPTCCAQAKPACNSCNSCETKISETREPVEIVYKKTTYKTVYEPKTYSQVSYETAPYSSANVEQVEVVDNESVLLNDVK